MTRSLISISFLLFSILPGSLTNDEPEPRAVPTVVGILQKILNDFEENGFSIPEVNLGEEVGGFTDIKAEASGKFEKVVKAVKTYGFDLNLKAENITVSGVYDIEDLELPGLFPIFGRGEFSIGLEGLHLAIRAEVKPDFATEGFVTKIADFSLSLEKSTVRFDALMNDPDLADFLNELLSSLIPDLIRVLHKKVVPILELVLGYVMSEVVDCIKKEAVSGKLEECLRNITVLGYDLPEIPHFSSAILTSLK